jgi:hypothetical protein
VRFLGEMFKMKRWQNVESEVKQMWNGHHREFLEKRGYMSPPPGSGDRSNGEDKLQFLHGEVVKALKVVKKSKTRANSNVSSYAPPILASAPSEDYPMLPPINRR